MTAGVYNHRLLTNENWGDIIEKLTQHTIVDAGHKLPVVRCCPQKVHLEIIVLVKFLGR